MLFNVSALKIHMSESAHEAIMAFPEFTTECRGDIIVKVRLIPYIWLTGNNLFSDSLIRRCIHLTRKFVLLWNFAFQLCEFCIELLIYHTDWTNQYQYWSTETGTVKRSVCRLQCLGNSFFTTDITISYADITFWISARQQTRFLWSRPSYNDSLMDRSRRYR